MWCLWRWERLGHSVRLVRWVRLWRLVRLGLRRNACTVSVGVLQCVLAAWYVFAYVALLVFLIFIIIYLFL